MANVTKPALKIRHYSKYLALALIVAGVPVLIFDNNIRAEIPLLVGLFTLFITTEKNEDERSIQMKSSSLYVAFIIAYGVKLITTNLHDHSLTSFELTEINHFLILMPALANVIFYGRMYLVKE